MTKPRLAYFICTTPRTGSSFLCQVLGSTLIAGRPSEYFGYRHTITCADQSTAALTDLITMTLERGTTPNGVFGAKLFWDHFSLLTNMIRHSGPNQPPSLSIPQLLSPAFPGLHYILLTRRDKIRQAVSLDRALRTNIWDSQQKKSRNFRPQPAFNFERINLLYYRLLAYENNWRNYFAAHGISPFKLAYEDLIEGYETITAGILEYLNLPAYEARPIRKPTLPKMSDEITDQWVKDYVKIIQQRPETILRTQRHLATLLSSLWDTQNREEYNRRMKSLFHHREAVK